MSIPRASLKMFSLIVNGVTTSIGPAPATPFATFSASSTPNGFQVTAQADYDTVVNHNVELIMTETSRSPEERKTTKHKIKPHHIKQELDRENRINLTTIYFSVFAGRYQSGKKYILSVDDYDQPLITSNNPEIDVT